MTVRAFLFSLATFLVLTGPAIEVALGQHGGAPAYVVIVNPSNPTRSVTRRFLADALLKRTTRWSHGETIRPVDLDIDSAVRRRVTEEVLGRTVAAVRSYWQQMIFSGRGVPPVEFNTDRAVVRYVATHSGAIGYVAGNADTTGVTVVTLR